MSAVWQTLDNIAGNNLFRLNDGAQINWLKSFSKKDLLDTIVKSQWIKSDVNQNEAIDSVRKTSKHFESRNAATDTHRERNRKKKKKKKRNFNMQKDNLYIAEKQSRDIGSIVDCSYNIPRITARLEGLMGTNVVRLTDRLYMQELRQNHEADCNAKLQERIDRRETQEIERERNLIMQGKLAKIPEKIANHPVIQIGQKTNEIIGRRRARLKTNREKNAERLMRQGTKWERDRLIFERHEEMQAMEEQAKKDEQSELQDQYRNEDAIRGLDLLRIQDKEWKLCEMDLKNFLEKENAVMKKGLLRKSVQKSSDPLDVQHIVKARKKFRETEEKIRRVLEEQVANSKDLSNSKQYLAQTATASAVSRKVADDQSETDRIAKSALDADRNQLPSSEAGLQTDENLSVSGCETGDETDDNYGAIHKTQMDEDIKNHLIITKEKFDALHYEDPLIAQLKKTDNVHDLYRVARDIICADKSEILEKNEDDRISNE